MGDDEWLTELIEDLVPAFGPNLGEDERTAIRRLLAAALEEMGYVPPSSIRGLENAVLDLETAKPSRD